ncbi:hypothetical protein RHGRI_004458 [Rhododendron griersonianum]|uniref:Uncharacterized protein n=1 Tax=Rhododendron griersonianum TaxID=479676 RepID=A0AAV6L9R6_9ERIC|nr:hypothetical protein RHGRI_004458 [Rhododendron griersonianum]
MRVEKWRLYLKKADLIRKQAKLVPEALKSLKSLGERGSLKLSRHRGSSQTIMVSVVISSAKTRVLC